MDKKEDRITFIVLIIANICVITFLAITCNMLYKVEKSKKVEYLNELIESNTKNEGKEAYVVVKSISPKFAKNKDSSTGYYFASDGKYNYVINIDDKKADELFKRDLENEEIKLYGVTKKVSEKLKELVIDIYNNHKEEDKRISLNDYYSYFGDIYLEQKNIKE